MFIILPIVAVFLFGFCARYVIGHSGDWVKWLNNFIIYLSLPSLILLKVPQLGFSLEMIIPAGVAWAWLLVGSVLVLIFSRWLKWARTTEGAMLLLVTMGNTSFLGYPMVLAFFNDTVLSYAIFFDQLGGFLILSTFGVIIVATYSPAQDDSNRVGLIDVIQRIVRFPPFIALLIALFIPLDSVMRIAQPSLEILGKLLMPAALVVLGIQFEPKILAQHRVPLYSGIALKMVAAPLFAAGLLLIFNVDGDVRIATIFEAAMPCMVTPGLMAINAGIAPRFVATLLGYSTVFAFVSLPLVAWLIA